MTTDRVSGRIVCRCELSNRTGASWGDGEENKNYGFVVGAADVTAWDLSLSSGFFTARFFGRLSGHIGTRTENMSFPMTKKMLTISKSIVFTCVHTNFVPVLMYVNTRNCGVSVHCRLNY